MTTTRFDLRYNPVADPGGVWEEFKRFSCSLNITCNPLWTPCLGLLAFFKSVCNISVYVTAHRCAGGLKKKVQLDLTSGSHTKHILVGFYNMPVGPFLRSLQCAGPPLSRIGIQLIACKPTVIEQDNGKIHFAIVLVPIRYLPLPNFEIMGIASLLIEQCLCIFFIKKKTKNIRSRIVKNA